LFFLSPRALVVLTLAGSFSTNVKAQDGLEAAAPYYIYGNPSCKDLNYCDDPQYSRITKDWQLKLDFRPPSGLSGPYPFTTGNGRILSGGATPDPFHSISITRNGNFFNWSANRTISAVIVKGGSGANVYVYDPHSLGGSPLGNGLSTPKDGRYGISHIKFCFEQPLNPSAALVAVSGRVTNGEGNGIAKARITITDDTGETRVALTNGFGYYYFSDVEVGRTYVIAPAKKGYEFVPQVVFLTDAVANLDFIAM
jgi:Carboxypeptidase regulatory-like domain